jgi:hypothetical protein
MTTSDPPHTDGDDHQLLKLVAAVLHRHEPVPPDAMQQAFAARLMAAVEAEVAELVFDSLTMQAAPMRRGAEGESRYLSFTNDHLTLDLVLMADGRTVVGQIEPVLADRVRLELSDDTVVDAAVDQFGRFRTMGGACSFRLRVPGHLVTQWISRRIDQSRP